MTPVLCVQARLFEKTVEFRFPEAHHRTEGGVLTITTKGQEVVVFNSPVWQVVWYENDQGQPLGFSPSSDSTSIPLPQHASVSNSPSPSETAFQSVTLPVAADPLSLSAIQAALQAAPYHSLASFSERIRQNTKDTEKRLLYFLQNHQLDAVLLKDDFIQSVLDKYLPPLVQQFPDSTPQHLKATLQALKRLPEFKNQPNSFDFIQIQLWKKFHAS